MIALASSAPSALWYLTRATGAVTLVLLTVSVALGVANVGRLQSTRLPRFVVEGLHRNVSLLAIAMLAVHIVTTVLDPFASIRLLDALIPFIASYRPFWLGLGAVAADLLLAIALTSIVRRRLGHRAWRATHWLAYLCWPVALLHALGTGSDIRQAWMQALLACCTLAIMAAVWARAGFGWPRRRGRRSAAIAASIALPALLAVWLPGGPLAAGWARRAGTPLVASVAGSASAAPAASSAKAQQVSAFSARVSGSVSQHTTGTGLVEVDLSLMVTNASLPSLAVRIDGTAVGGGVHMRSSAVAIGSASDPARYQGVITSLDGTDISARVVSAHGQTLQLKLALAVNSAEGTASGVVSVSAD